MSRPRIVMRGLNGCSGCQLSLLNAETELPRLLQAVTLVDAPLLLDQATPAPYDLALVEGAVSTAEEAASLCRLRQQSRLLVAIGSCAVWGGIATLRCREPRQQLVTAVYGSEAPLAAGTHPQPLSRFVSVDASAPGCPPEPAQLLEVIAAAARGCLPPLPDYPVCLECRSREIDCLLTEHRQPCLGPLTRAGCQARCPAVNVPCEGCRGPAADANLPAGLQLLRAQGLSEAEVISRMQRFCPEWPHDPEH